MNLKMFSLTLIVSVNLYASEQKSEAYVCAAPGVGPVAERIISQPEISDKRQKVQELMALPIKDVDTKELNRFYEEHMELFGFFLKGCKPRSDGVVSPKNSAICSQLQNRIAEIIEEYTQRDEEKLKENNNTISEIEPNLDSINDLSPGLRQFLVISYNHYRTTGQRCL